MRRSLLALLALPVVAGAWLALGPLRHEKARAHDTKPAAGVAEATPAARGAAPIAAGDTDEPAREQAPDPRIASISSEGDLGRYLGDVERAARARGEVRPEDYRHGGAAIKQLESALGRDRVAIMARDFGMRLSRLSKELEQKPITDELDRQIAALQTEQDPAARRKLADRYRVVAAGLPQLERLDAMRRLQQAESKL